MSKWPFLALYIHLSLSLYTNEPPVKLLQVESLADRYNASASDYRTSLTNGYDEDAHRTATEELNGFPELRLILNPGGCAEYRLPVEADQKFAIILPARKNVGGPYEDYCPRARVDVGVEANGLRTEFVCFASADNCDATSCTGSFQSVISDEVTEIEMSLCVAESDPNTAAIWEILISKANESSKIQGVFMDDARKRFQLTQTIPDFDKQLSVVSIVGGRGVGKSTVCSLLSGNHSMFTTGSGSVGTTTTGADISTIIPTTDYADILGGQLGMELQKASEVLPLFLIDSEGMGVRGDAFDFITTSPPAVIAKVIIYIGEGSMNTVDILYDIDGYLNGLNNIIMDGSGGEKMCKSPNYGHFVVVINKMMGNATDEQLLQELMTKEPDWVDGYLERNEIRDKITDCFNGISVHGLPVLSIESGQEIDYPILDDRFKGGLAAMANTIIEKSDVLRNVTVGGLSLEFNSTTAEGIISTVIEEANEGKIDLTGFQSFWKIVIFQVENELSQSQSTLDVSLPLCSLNKLVTCSECACIFRNDVIDQTLKNIEIIFEMSSKQSLQMFGEDVTDLIAEEYEIVIEPWVTDNQCAGVTSLAKKLEDFCDFSVIGDVLSPDTSLNIECNYGFLCGALTYSASNVSFHINNLFISKQTSIEILAPAKSPTGSNGDVGGDGGNGEDGVQGSNLYIVIENLMKASSADYLIVTTYGGDGGDGGQGGQGLPGENGVDGQNGGKGVNGGKGKPGKNAVEDDLESIPPELTTAAGVCDKNGKAQIGHDSECHTICWCYCNLCDEWWRWRYNWTTSVAGGRGGTGEDGGRGGNGTDGTDGGPGGQGGRGGQGGAGASAGDVFVVGAQFKPIVNKIGGKGGVGGLGGLGGSGGIPGQGGLPGVGGDAGAGGDGGMGLEQFTYFYCTSHEHRECDCGGAQVWDCGDKHTSYPAPDGYDVDPSVTQECCQGVEGDPGQPGDFGERGNPGLAGHQGQDGEEGQNGQDA